MPLVSIIPTSESVEEALAEKIDQVRKELKEAICHISGFPEDDVLINLLSCPMRNADPASADMVVYADTCPHEELEARADELRNAIAGTIAMLGFSDGNGAEIWPRFLPGPWCLVKHGAIVDKVSHKR